MNKKIVCITGCNGQDGAHLIRFLLSKNYEVHGIVRRNSYYSVSPRLEYLYEEPQVRENLFYHYGDMTDSESLHKVVRNVKPDEVYNLAAQSHVAVSFINPHYTMLVNSVGTLSLLEIIKDFSEETGKVIKFYQASSSEMFGNSKEVPQNENTPFAPRSPYGVSKVAAYYSSKLYRETYGMFVSNGILFNHEGIFRGRSFVSRKITQAVARIKLELQRKLYLGNLDAKRDWGSAEEYVQQMWKILQQDEPDDFVIATGETHSVKEFVEEAFSYCGLDWEKHVEIDPRYIRPSEVNILQGDYSKAKEVLGWEPKTKFKDLVKLMCDHDLKLAEQEKRNLI